MRVVHTADGRQALDLASALGSFLIDSHRILTSASQEEKEWLGEVMSPFGIPSDREGMLLRWARALQSYGTKLDFLTGLSRTTETYNVHDGLVQGVRVLISKAGLRGQLMTAQPPYPYKKKRPIMMLGFR